LKDTALVRFINLSSDTASEFSGGMDFTLADTLGATGLTFEQYTPYLKVVAGNSSYQVLLPTPTRQVVLR